MHYLTLTIPKLMVTKKSERATTDLRVLSIQPYTMTLNKYVTFLFSIVPRRKYYYYFKEVMKIKDRILNQEVILFHISFCNLYSN